MTSLPYLEGGPLFLAIVGPIGPRVNANVLAEQLAQQAVIQTDARIISGFAEGIDKHAHLGGVDVFGRTIAFLPHGIMNSEYYTNTPLFRWLMPLLGGGFVSEYFLTEVNPNGQMSITDEKKERETANANEMLLLRDGRTTSLADVVIVIEGSRTSGSEDTGRRAFLQGKLVFVIDWPMINPKFSRGLPPPINGGLKRLAGEGCALSFPLRNEGRIINLDDLPRLFIEYILQTLEQEKRTPGQFYEAIAKQKRDNRPTTP